MIVRNAAQTALNDLAVTTRDLADRYQDAQELMSLEEIRGLFGELTKRHGAAAERLAELVRRTGDLPALPDADWESLERLYLTARSRGGGNPALLHTLAERERHLGRQAEQARHSAHLGEEAEQWLSEIGKRAFATARQLELLAED